MKKKLFILGGLAAVGALALLLHHRPVAADIASSAHDFSGDAWSGNEICKPCHTPHNAKTGTSDLAPLWNHQVTAATFTVYANNANHNTLNATVGQPNGTSKACLSCHDGSVALDAYGASSTGTTTITGTALVGTDLSNDHPISFVYNAALVTSDGELATPTTTAPVTVGATTPQLPLFGAAGSATMECASCHDVHNKPLAGTPPSLLLVDNAGSALCLKCHTK